MGDSLSITIPMPYIRRFALRAGDVVSFEHDNTGLKMKFTKLSNREPVAEEQHEAV
jgi:antitoxin component of MazEF toxin-antitoxin module